MNAPAVILDSALHALADPARRQAVDLLLRGPCSAGEIAAEVGLSAPGMSRHLRVLRECGLVESAFSDTDARVRLYRLRPQPLAALRKWLDGFDSHWGAQLEAFKKHADAKGKRR